MKLKRLLWIFLCFLSDQAAPCQVRCGLSDKWRTYFKNHFHTSDLSQLKKIASFNAQWTLSSSQSFLVPLSWLTSKNDRPCKWKYLVFLTSMCSLLICVMLGTSCTLILIPFPPAKEKLEICQCPLTRHPLLAVQKCPSFPFSNAPFEQLQ